MPWQDVFRLFKYAFTGDPLSQKANREDIPGAGVTSPEAIDVLRGSHDGMGGAGRGFVRLHETNEFVDMTSVTNRQNRYKEYERLRNVAEIETALTIFADEACVGGDTPVATPFGLQKIKELVNRDPEDRFLVYCWDHSTNDFTLGWAYNARKVGVRPACQVVLDDGSRTTCTKDHRFLLKNGEWKRADKLVYGDELVAFYRIPANTYLTKLKTNQFPRIFTYSYGWTHEREFVNIWKTGEQDDQSCNVHKSARLLSSGMSTRKTSKTLGLHIDTIEGRLQRMGFSSREMKWLGKKRTVRRVIAVHHAPDQEVYDLSVENHENFCTGSTVVHNCQKGENNHVIKVECRNKDVKEEVEWLLFTQLKIDRKLWNFAKNLFVYGDWFGEIVINSDNPKDGILKVQPLPADSMYRIETTRGRLIEFQQSKEGPDYQALEKIDVSRATDEEMAESTAIRFSPDQIVHMKIGDDRKTFYPYGISLIEPARGPAHQLRMMEDAMLVYRLTRAPERRVFYIDVGSLAPFRSEAFMERMKSQFKKKKTNGRSALPGASSVEERWHAPAADEDYWIPVRQGSNTRIETLPGAQNLGEIDDAIYFRKKLLVALNIPEGYMASSETSQIQTRITLSAQDVKFARLVERLQANIEDGIHAIVTRHLHLRGYPEDSFEDLNLKITPPSDWRELSRAEVITNRLNNASTLKGSQLWSDYDILLQIFKFSEEETERMIARMKVQKLEEMKLQILAQNPGLLGVGVPGDGDQDIPSEPGKMGEQDITPDEDNQQPPPQPGGEQPQGEPSEGEPQGDKPQSNAPTMQIPDPTEDEIKRYDLGIEDYNSQQDEEDIDYSEI